VNGAALNVGQLSPIDFALSVMDNPQRPVDFMLVFHLTDAPSLDALRAGARSARHLYPTTGSYISGKNWKRGHEPNDDGVRAIASSGNNINELIQEFLARPIEIACQVPVQQLVITNKHSAAIKLVTRIHHAAADGLSAGMWIGHQLRVASGTESPVVDSHPFQPLPLRTHNQPVRKSRFAHHGASHRLWTPGVNSSGQRHWQTIQIDANGLRKAIRRAGGFTYNDLLATCALEVFARWNRLHSDQLQPKIGLWLPINIRRRAADGFGNGTGRIRLYACYPGDASLLDKGRQVRRQISWTIQHGEWAVPENNPLDFLPHWAAAPLLRGYFNRPGVDMATGVFSHAERWTGAGGEIFTSVEKIESIGQLHAHHCVAINGATHLGRTWLTFTYDDGLISAHDIRTLIELYEGQIALARRELG
jgi:hypothetical protein